MKFIAKLVCITCIRSEVLAIKLDVCMVSTQTYMYILNDVLCYKVTLLVGDLIKYRSKQYVCVWCQKHI